MLIRIITWIIVGVVVYRVLDRFVLPIFRISSAASSHMRQMQDQMNEMNRKMNANQPPPPPQKMVAKEGDYIDYEDVK